MTVSALARRVDIPLATTHRVVVQLVNQRLLERDENGEVRLGVRLWELFPVHSLVRVVSIPRTGRKELARREDRQPPSRRSVCPRHITQVLVHDIDQLCAGQPARHV
nr:helix-turn-helix domain-containing protein [Cryobacterium glaciale]